MVEAIANGIEDKLIDGLSFKMTPGASYVVDRRSVTYHPQGSNIYKVGAGTKLIRILLTGDNWLDPSTLRVMFTLNNDNTTGEGRLRPLGGPWCFFRRMRILAAGQLVEDIDNYNRIHEMMHTLIARESRENDAAEAFGQYFDPHAWFNGALTKDNYLGINTNQAVTVLFKPLSGLLNQNKMLPIRYAPITIELELVDTATEPVMSTPTSGSPLDLGSVGNAGAFTNLNSTSNWSINNVQVKVDVCTLDNALDNSYAQHLLSGKSLPISYNTFVSQMQTIAGQDAPLINVSRALTRLKSVFVTLNKDITGSRAWYLGRKNWNDFFSPMSVDNSGRFTVNHNPDGEFEFQLQIGSKLFPEYPIRSHNEAYYQLKKTLGVQASAVHNFDITPVEYRDNKFILGTDCEKVLDAGFTGLNTRAGDLMSVKFKYAARGSGDSRLADRIHIVLHSDQILEIRDSGCQVFD
jgi:hypothetical protein